MRVSQTRLRNRTAKIERKVFAIDFIRWLESLSTEEVELALLAINSNLMVIPHKAVREELSRQVERCPDDWGEFTSAAARDADVNESEVWSAHRDWLSNHRRFDYYLAQLLRLMELLNDDEAQTYLRPWALGEFVTLVHKACAMAGQLVGFQFDPTLITPRTIRTSLLAAHDAYEAHYQAAIAVACGKMEERLAQEAAKKAEKATKPDISDIAATNSHRSHPAHPSAENAENLPKPATPTVPLLPPPPWFPVMLMPYVWMQGDVGCYRVQPDTRFAFGDEFALSCYVFGARDSP